MTHQSRSSSCLLSRILLLRSLPFLKSTLGGCSKITRIRVKKILSLFLFPCIVNHWFRHHRSLISSSSSPSPFQRAATEALLSSSSSSSSSMEFFHGNVQKAAVRRECHASDSAWPYKRKFMQIQGDHCEYPPPTLAPSPTDVTRGGGREIEGIGGKEVNIPRSIILASQKTFWHAFRVSVTSPWRHHPQEIIPSPHPPPSPPCPLLPSPSVLRLHFISRKLPLIS